MLYEVITNPEDQNKKQIADDVGLDNLLEASKTEKTPGGVVDVEVSYNFV